MTPPQQECAPARGTLPLVLAIAVGGFLVGFRPVADMDYHWHLAQGRCYLEGTLPADADPFTHLPVVEAPTRQGWGGDVLFAVLDRLGGTTAVRLLLAGVLAAAWVVVFQLARRRSGDVLFALLVLGIFAATTRLRVRARPEIFSLLAPFLLLLVCSGRPTLRRGLGVFGLCALWVNLHSAAIAAPILAATTVPGSGWRRRLLWPAAALAGISVHPEGPAFLGSFATRTADLAPVIPEWQPLWHLDPARFTPEWILVALIAGLTAAAGTRWRHARPATVLLAGFGVVLGLKAVRFLHFLTLPVLATGDLPSGPRRSERRRRALLAAVVVAVFVAWPVTERLEAAAAARASGIPVFADIHTPQYPVAAARWLTDHDLRGKLFHPAGWGGYLAAELDGRYRTAADGRVNLYGPELAGALLHFEDATARARLVERLGLEILVLPPGVVPREEWADPAHRDDPKRRWLPVLHDGTAVVLVDLRGEHREHNLAALRAARVTPR